MLKLRLKGAAFLVSVLLAAAAAVGCGSSPTTPTGPDPVGTWVGTAGSGTGATRVTLIITRNSNNYQGTVASDDGEIAQRTPITNVSWNAGTLTFTFQLADGTGVNVVAQIDGDNMTGSWVDAEGERGTFVFTRSR